jgi:tRNA(adenine34) deaminase
MEEKSMRKYMNLAIKQAMKSQENLRCGVVIVKGGKVIAKASNLQKVTNNATAHAEINAIRKAGKKLGTKRLDGCEIYGTCEPCQMCLSAIIFSNMQKMVYGLTLKNVTPKERLIDIDIDTFLSKAPHKIEVIKNFMEEECKKTLRN